MSQARAIALVEQFRKGADSGPPAFGKLTTRADLAADLLARVRTPELIDQGFASLCGPAAFMYLIANARPEVYVQYAIDLYTSGKGNIGRLRISPGRDCRSALPGSSVIRPVEWITLASLRDSSNSILDYDSTDGLSDLTAGVTPPGEMVGWLRGSGLFSAVASNTSLVFDQGMRTLVDANNAYGKSMYVALLVGYTALYNIAGGTAFPDHWLVLRSSIKVGGKPLPAIWPRTHKRFRQRFPADPQVPLPQPVDPDYVEGMNDVAKKSIDFSYYSWGEVRSTATKRVRVEDFMDRFYGYVSLI